MASKTCERCGRNFRAPSYLKMHLRRKTPCAPILEIEDLPPEVLEDPHLDRKKCRFCGRVFSSYDGMRRHVRTSCKIAPNARNAQNGNEGMELLYEHTIRRQNALLEAKDRQIEQLTELVTRQLEAASGGVAVNAPGDHNRVAVDNRRAITNVTINVFGQEAMEHVTADKIRRILEESIQTPPARPASASAAQAAVLKTAMLIYSDPEHPENLTCYMPNKKTNEALVHTAGGWEVQPVPLVVTPMAKKSLDELFEKQPFDNADMFEPLMVELRDNEARYAEGGELRPILVRNKDLLTRALETLPVSGQSSGGI